jgi:hypothetical protein
MGEACHGSLMFRIHFSGSNVHAIATKRCFVSAALTVAIRFFVVNM